MIFKDPNRVAVEVATTGAVQALASFDVEHRLVQRAFHLAVFHEALTVNLVAGILLILTAVITIILSKGKAAA